MSLVIGTFTVHEQYSISSSAGSCERGHKARWMVRNMLPYRDVPFLLRPKVSSSLLGDTMVPNIEKDYILFLGVYYLI